MLMRGLGVFVGFLVVALLVVICRRMMRFGGVLVMFGCLAVCFVCHKDPLFPG